MNYLESVAYNYQSAIDNLLLNEQKAAVYMSGLTEEEHFIYSQRLWHKKPYRTIAAQVGMPWTEVRKIYKRVKTGYDNAWNS